MQSPSEFLRQTIKDHEGGLSMNVNDNGNWFDPKRYAAHLSQQRRMGTLVGSKFGVTAYALCAYRRVSSVTAKDIANLTLDEAAAIGVRNYYQIPDFDRLPWDRVIAAVVDTGWGSGPHQAAKLFQRVCGAHDDGDIGPLTVKAYRNYRVKTSEADAARAFSAERDKFYLLLATNQGPSDPDRRFLHGWENRSASFLPGTSWWKENE